MELVERNLSPTHQITPGSSSAGQDAALARCQQLCSDTAETTTEWEICVLECLAEKVS